MFPFIQQGNTHVDIGDVGKQQDYAVIVIPHWKHLDDYDIHDNVTSEIFINFAAFKDHPNAGLVSDVSTLVSVY